MKFSVTFNELTQSQLLGLMATFENQKPVETKVDEKVEEPKKKKAATKKLNKKQIEETELEADDVEEDEDDFGYDPESDEEEMEYEDDEEAISKEDVLAAFKAHHKKIASKSKDSAAGIKAARMETGKILKKLKAKAIDAIKPAQYATALKLLK